MPDQSGTTARLDDRALVLLSGGVDSAVALAWALGQRWDVVPIEFDYRGRPCREREASSRIAMAAGVPEPMEIEVPLLERVGATHAEGGRPGDRGDGLPVGYIPHRNLVYYSLALAAAARLRARWIVGGHLGTDGETYADARADYFDALNALVARGTPAALGPPCRIVLPLAAMTKEECLREGARRGVPFALTWSCYLDGPIHCGTCAGCVDRRIGFTNARIADPVPYAAPLPDLSSFTGGRTP
jgi:7-cyano-7-deazaguanine synthase